ncbi:unnamed protein product [Cyprideis torosa]|uniref:Uncharacterized protein n=1 Tax=Cyprideis torosa TaxID=163714 RepID=A0A7R8W3G0_9CRUS|nr:unnamed protein product [Cyprideis torosa]CAG0878796.1 unnamed protein product [Cyprideis torosa]
MDIAQSQALVADEMSRVDAVIRENLASDVVLINQLSHYIISSGGKRLRPQLVLMAANACAYSGNKHITVAAIIEFIHTATLLHDDVVDASELRRGRDTANNIWGNEAAVLVGDFLYSRAFEMMVTVDSMQVMQILAGTTNIIAEGEVMQLLNVNDAETTQERYLQVIRAKTARLFQAATHLGGVLSAASDDICMGLKRYGMHLGTAFQVIDDVLDYTQSAQEMGKNLGDDLAEGKPTLPLILAMKKGNQEQAACVKRAIETGGLDNIDGVLAAIHATGALDEARALAVAEALMAEEALHALPDSQWKAAMISIARFVTQRGH